jgi:hypothetical protein
MKKYKEVTEARRFGEITRMGNAKKNENDKWSRWESEEMRKNRTKTSRNEMEKMLKCVWKTRFGRRSEEIVCEGECRGESKY